MGKTTQLKRQMFGTIIISSWKFFDCCTHKNLVGLFGADEFQVSNLRSAVSLAAFKGEMHLKCIFTPAQSYVHIVTYICIITYIHLSNPIYEKICLIIYVCTCITYTNVHTYTLQNKYCYIDPICLYIYIHIKSIGWYIDPSTCIYIYIYVCLHLVYSTLILSIYTYIYI